MAYTYKKIEDYRGLELDQPGLQTRERVHDNTIEQFNLGYAHACTTTRRDELDELVCTCYQLTHRQSSGHVSLSHNRPATHK